MADDADKIEHHIKILQEVNTILPSEDAEFKAFEDSKQIVSDIDEVWRNDIESQIKDCIAEMMSVCAFEHSKLDSASAQKDLSGLNEVKESLLQHEQHQQAILAEVQDLQRGKEICESEREKLEADKENLENCTSKIIPAKRHDVKLYQKITGIRWQYDCVPGQIKGLISSQSKVQPFDLSQRLHSQFYISNQLWDLIEQTHSS